MTDAASVLFLGVLALVILVIGWKKNFFTLTSAMLSWPVPLRWFHVVSVFAIYFGVSGIITPIFGKILQHSFLANPQIDPFLYYASWLNFFNSGMIFIFLCIYFLFLSSTIRKGICHRNAPYFFKDDLQTALFAWILAFPLVLFVNQVLDWFASWLFNLPQIPEQLAVYFLKLTFKDPFYLLLATLTIVIFAPLIEELLFRGFLQSFIRQHLGTKQAIGITSLLFAFFHYSPEQGAANIPIVGSLFVFSLFIGFIYEKRGSLRAPITLHALFNILNVFNLYFLGGIPKSPL